VAAPVAPEATDLEILMGCLDGLLVAHGGHAEQVCGPVLYALPLQPAASAGPQS
jgi:hypothetical protein